MNVITETNKKPHAHIKLVVDDEILEATSTGDGAVDAAFNAIEKIIKSKCKLILYSVNNITSGTDSQGEVTVRITKDESIFNGHGADTDIVKASVLALINALNKFKQNPNLNSFKKTWHLVVSKLHNYFHEMNIDISWYDQHVSPSVNRIALSLEDLEKDVSSCSKCMLHETRHQTVFGEGPICSKL